MATKPKTGRARNRQERAGLSDEIELAIGMEVMVTFNISTDLDMANGARGHFVDIVLDPRECVQPSASHQVVLQYHPAFVLLEMKRIKAQTLPGLPTGVLPVAPLSRAFSITMTSGCRCTVTRIQLPITPAFAFTDYSAQAQTIEYCIVDIGSPPTGKITPFNAYVALSCSRGRESIRLLRDFDERLFIQHPCEHLRNEDRRLEEMDRATEAWWNLIDSGTDMYQRGTSNVLIV